MLRAAFWLVAVTFPSHGQPPQTVLDTYFGGSGYDIPGSVATDRDGNIYIPAAPIPPTSPSRMRSSPNHSMLLRTADFWECSL